MKNTKTILFLILITSLGLFSSCKVPNQLYYGQRRVQAKNQVGLVKRDIKHSFFKVRRPIPLYYMARKWIPNRTKTISYYYDQNTQELEKKLIVVTSYDLIRSKPRFRKRTICKK